MIIKRINIPLREVYKKNISLLIASIFFILIATNISFANQEIDIFIDDKLTTCQKVHDGGICTFIMNAPHNVELDEGDIKRIYSWPDLYYQIKMINLNK